MNWSIPPLKFRNFKNTSIYFNKYTIILRCYTLQIRQNSGTHRETYMPTSFYTDKYKSISSTSIFGSILKESLWTIVEAIIFLISKQLLHLNIFFSAYKRREKFPDLDRLDALQGTKTMKLFSTFQILITHFSLFCNTIPSKSLALQSMLCSDFPKQQHDFLNIWRIPFSSACILSLLPYNINEKLQL